MPITSIEGFGTPTPTVAEVKSSSCPKPVATLQPIFDPRVQPGAQYGANGSYWNVNVFRGTMQAYTAGDPLMTNTGHINFLFNPNTITVTYGAQDGLLAKDNQSAATSAGYALDTQIYVAFDLLFDRTYEIMSGEVPRGVLEDIEAFERMVAIDPMTMAMQKIPVTIQFGTDFRMIAWINQATAVYTHFTPGMVPIRAKLSVVATRISESAAFDPTGVTTTEQQAQKDATDKTAKDAAKQGAVDASKASAESQGVRVSPTLADVDFQGGA